MMVLRVHGDDLVFTSSLHQVPHRIPQMNMMKVHIPFTFKLVETSKSSYAGKPRKCMKFSKLLIIIHGDSSNVQIGLTVIK